MSDERENPDQPAVSAPDHAAWAPAPMAEPEHPWWASPGQRPQPAADAPGSAVPAGSAAAESVAAALAPAESVAATSAPAESAAPDAQSAGEAAASASSRPRYGADPHLGAFPYGGPDAGAQDSARPVYQSLQYAPPTYPPSPAYPSYPPAYAPAYNAPPSYGQAYNAPPAFAPPTAPGYGSAGPYAAPQGPQYPLYPEAGGEKGKGRGAGRGWPSLFVVAGISALIGAIVAGGLVAATKKTDKTAAVVTSPPTAVPQPVVNVPVGSVAQIARALLPSVVSIIVTSGDSGDEGTGIVLTSDGSILTNNHVVEAAATSGIIAVTLNDGRTVKATIVGRDPTTDLAVIKAANVTGLHPATLGQDSSLVVGQQVIAIGSPLGLSNTVTSGIVSSLNRPVCTQDCAGTGSNTSVTPTVLDAIQTDAAINPGNSGGPLVDMAGQVVGVNSAIATLDQGQSSPDAQSGSIGVGFSIPIDEARRVVDELQKTGHANHAVLGIGLQDSVDSTLHTPNGARVVSVSPGGPSAKSGLQVGDIIVTFGARTIVDADSLIAATHAAVPSSTVSISYMRSGQSTTVQLVLGSAASS